MVTAEAGSGELHPLSFGQRWLQYVADNSPELAKPVQRIYRLCEPLNSSALLRAFQRVVAANEALGMQLVAGPSGWRQRFVAWEPEIEGTAIHGATVDHRLAYARQLLGSALAQPMDLTCQPPLRAQLVRTDAEHYLALTVDHRAADDMGFDQLEFQLAATYRAEKAGATPPDLTGQHGRFVAYLARESAAAASAAGALQHWQRSLDGVPLAPPAAAAMTWVPGQGAEWRFAAAVLRDVAQACRQQQTSPFVAMLTAQALLMQELSGQHDLVLNIPISNRTTPADRTLVANLSMLAHLRITLGSGATARATLQHVRDAVLQAMANRHYDYGALSHAVAEQARARGGHAQFAAGCSYVVDSGDRAGQVGRVFQRLDDAVPTAPKVPRGSFALTCRQHPAHLDLSVIWDHAAWPVMAAELPQRFTGWLQRALGLPEPLQLQSEASDHP